MSIKNFEENYEIYDTSFKSPSPFKELKFITEDIKYLKKDNIMYLENNVNRADTITKLVNIFNDMDKSIEIEAGLFEFSLVYSLNNKLVNDLMPAVYNDKLSEILQNISSESRKINKGLLKRIEKNQIDPQNIAFLTPQEINPKVWSLFIKKNELREYKKKNMAATDLYKCYKCGERKCQVMQLQTRSADEPMTCFITCLVCFNTFKK